MSSKPSTFRNFCGLSKMKRYISIIIIREIISIAAYDRISFYQMWSAIGPQQIINFWVILIYKCLILYFNAISRPLRLDFLNALYYIITCGDRRKVIYDYGEDREVILKSLSKKVGIAIPVV
jgi:hypothetical protein